MKIARMLKQVKTLAKEYYSLRRRPLGVTGEVAELEAKRLLRLKLAPPRQAGYDALRRKGGKETRLEIKGRCIQPDAKPGQRLGRIRLDREWDAVLLVLLDGDLEPTEIYDASRSAVERAIKARGSRARGRGALPVSKFTSIGERVWPRRALPAPDRSSRRPSPSP